MLRFSDVYRFFFFFSSEDWFENEDQMAKVIIDAEMFMSGNKQMLALEYLSRSL